MPNMANTIILACCACGRRFERPRATLTGQRLVACPHCATLQAARPVEGEPPLPPGGTASTGWRKGV